MNKKKVKNKIDNKNKKLSFKEFINIAFWGIKIFYRIFPVELIIYAFTSIAKNFQSMVYSFAIAGIIDQVILIKKDNLSIDSIYIYFIFIGIFFLIMETVNYMYNYIGWRFDTFSQNRYEELIFTHLSRLSIKQIEDPNINNKAASARQFMQNALKSFIDSSIATTTFFIVFVSSGFLLLATCPYIFLFLIPYAVIRFFIERKYVKESFNFIIKNVEPRRIAYMGSQFLVLPSRLVETKLSNAVNFIKNSFINFFDNINKENMRLIRKRTLAIYLFDLTSSFLNLFTFVFVVFNFVSSKILTIGNLSFQLNLVYSAFNYFDSFLGQLIRISDQAVRIKEVYEFFNIVPENQEYKKIKLDKLKNPLPIELKNVDFKYENSEKYIYKNFNLKINPGEKVAIVGENGAGKTTLIRLLMGMYDIQKGEILIEDKNIKNIIPETFYRNFGVLFQDYNFYAHLTVRENVIISSDKKRHNDKDVIECLKQAEAYDFVKEYKNGLSQILNEVIKGGIKPSTGQKQKIAIARFFYQNSPFVIFDEPTSSIDAKSEYNIFNNIYKYFKNKTVIIVSHRFSTIKNADRIIVIDKGQIIEEGNHEYLMKLGGMYAKSFKMQAEGYNS